MPPIAVGVAGMVAVQILISGMGLTLPVLAPVAAPDFGVEPHLVGYYFALHYAFACISSLASGTVIARFGAIRVSQAGLVMVGCGLAIVAAASPALMPLSALILGLGYGPATPASSALLARITPPHLFNLIFSIKQTGVPLGFLAAGVALPSLSLLLGWQGTLLVVAGVACLLAVAIEPLHRGYDTDLDPRPARLQAILVRPLRMIFADRVLLLLSVTSLTFAGMQSTLAAFLVTYLTTQIGMSLVAAGLLMSLTQIAGAVGRVVWGMLADWSGRPMLTMAGLGLGMSACALVFGLITRAWPMTAIGAVCMVFGATAIAWNGIFLAQLARYAPKGRTGEITGGSSFMTFGGVTIMPAVFTSILSATGSYALGFAVLAALTFVSGLAYLREARVNP